MGLVALAAAGCLLVGHSTHGQLPVIASFSQNGELVCTNLAPGTGATVEWAPSLAGPWTNSWAGLESIAADAQGSIRVSVPMFYRVRAGTPSGMMVLIPGGSFVMGDTFGEGDADEIPTHGVQVSGCYMDKYEVTKGLWEAVKEWADTNGYAFDHPGSAKAAGHPAHSMSWYDAVKWCNARSQMESLSPCYYTDAGLTMVYRNGQVAPFVKWNGNGYRLPTEAEWEKAARGGAEGRRFAWWDTDTITHGRANYYSDTGYAYDVSPTRGYHPDYKTGDSPHTSPVWVFAPNAFGLCDMAGNVGEWCWDWHDPNWYTNPAAVELDTTGPSTGTHRIRRGGGWDNYASGIRCASREHDAPTEVSFVVGFRCVRRL